MSIDQLRMRRAGARPRRLGRVATSIIATIVTPLHSRDICLPLRRNYTLLNTKTFQLYEAMLKFYLTNNNINIFG